MLALAASAAAATLKVPQQYETIQEAVNAAEPGDTIVVSKGVYYESVTVGTSGLKIIGKKAVIDGTFEGAALSTEAVLNFSCLEVYGSGVTIQGMTFRNGGNHVSFSTTGLRVLKCVSRNSGGSSVTGEGEGIEVSGNRFVGAAYAGVNIGGDGVTVTKNAIQQSGSYGIQIGGGTIVVDGNTVNGVSDSVGVYVSGNDSVVTRNRVSNCGGAGIFFNGSNGFVTANRVSWISSDTGIYVAGGECLVQGNSVVVASTLLGVYGPGNDVLDNRAAQCYAAYGVGIQVVGDQAVVSGNLVDQVAEYGTGFVVGGSGLVVSDNAVQDISGHGFEFNSIIDSEVSGLRALRCGFRGFLASILVYGTGNTFTGVSVVEAHGDGIRVLGTGNEFVSCTVTDPTVNGFIVYGGGNTFTSCSARGSGGQGMHNRGVNTVLSGGVYLDNRLDIANQFNLGANFLGGIASATYETGGETTVPILFYDL